MSDFGEELSSLMAKKTISAENLCQMAELNPAYLEKLKCGKLLPSNYGVVKKISEVLGLVPEERYQLWNSYKVSKLGEKHMCTEEALKALFALPAARPQRVPGEINAVSLQNGVPICGRERVYQAIRQLLRESTDSADLLLHVEQQEFCRILGEEIWEKGADYRCRLLLYLREERMAEKNVASFGMLVPALLSGRIEVHYNYIVAEKLVDYILFPFLIRTEQALLLLNQELTEMGALCEEIISLASQALVSYDKALGEKVSKVGAKIDEEERTIETICMRLLLRQQPVARDLRAVSAALKMITDMERIGDQAEDIVEIIPCMIAHPHEEYPKIREMAKETIAMVTDSVDAYVKQDVYLA